MEISEHSQKKNRHLKKYKRALVLGSFSPLHYAHIRLFKQAKEISEKVYACTESNKIIWETKGDPFTTEKERMEDLRGIKYLDGVLIRRGRREDIIEQVKSDVLILGNDHDWGKKRYGIDVVYFKYTQGISSTKLKRCIHTSEQTSQTKDTE